MKNLHETKSTEEFVNCGEVKEVIDELEDNQPENPKEYKIWKEKINNLMGIYNNLCNFRAYKEIH